MDESSIQWKTIVPLLHKQLKGIQLSNKERRTLDAWLAENNNNPILRQEILDQQAFTNELAAYENFHWVDGVEKLAADGVPVINDEPGGGRIYWLRYMMAAAVVILMVVAGYLWISRDHSKTNDDKPVIVQKQNDLPPGKYRARLTLADGSTIVLDSVNTDSLTRQGMATVANKNGKLVYNAAGANGKHGAIAMNTLTTAKAETYQLLLSDGSKVWLNAGSSIRFPVSFTERVRRVEITGEVYFEVAHNEKKPFIVKAGETEIQVLGTSFNVNAYTDEGAIKTTLLTGKVKIVNEEQETAVLTPGEQAQESKGNIKVIDEVNVDQVVAWRFGLFQFNRDDIRTVMRQVARWYDVEVSYEGQIPKIEFWGKISRDLNAAEMCKVLERYGVHFRIEGKKIIVTP